MSLPCIESSPALREKIMTLVDRCNSTRAGAHRRPAEREISVGRGGLYATPQLAGRDSSRASAQSWRRLAGCSRGAKRG